jgi:hypothetical protein
VHETDNTNPGADAAMHNRYLHNGAEGRQASWHFTVDDHSIYQHIPITEVTWQAADGAGPGNMSGISAEHCVNLDGDESKTRHHGEALFGGIMRALNMDVATRLKRHWDFNEGTIDRHHCPDHMMNTGYWPTFVANASTVAAADVVLPPKPPVTYAKPVIPVWMTETELAKGVDRTLNGVKLFACRRVWKAAKATPRLRSAGASSEKVGPDLNKGEQFLGEFIFQNSAGWWILTRFGTRVRMADVTPNVAIQAA